MILCGSEYKRTFKSIWKEKEASFAASDPKISKKAVCDKEKIVLKTISICIFPNDLGFDKNQLPEFPMYDPPFNLQKQQSKLLVSDLTKLEIFQQFLMSSIMVRIVENTNSYTENFYKNCSFCLWQ